MSHIGVHDTISPKVVSDTIDWLRSEYENVFEDGSGLMKVVWILLTIIIVLIHTYVEKRKSCFGESGTDLNLVPLVKRGICLVD